MKSEIILFYEGGVDHQGRTLEEILKFDNAEFDACHDFIQWIFPLHEDSRMSYTKFPLITKEDHEYFMESPECRLKMRRALDRFRQFLDTVGVDYWCNDGDHNLIRITRLIRSLRFFGYETMAEWIYNDYSKKAIERGLKGITVMYWNRALKEPLFNTLY